MGNSTSSLLVSQIPSGDDGVQEKAWRVDRLHLPHKFRLCIVVESVTECVQTQTRGDMQRRQTARILNNIDIFESEWHASVWHHPCFEQLFHHTDEDADLVDEMPERFGSLGLGAEWYKLN